MKRSLLAAAFAVGLVGCGSDAGPAHVLFISDSSSGAAAPAYTEMAEAALGRKVELIDWRVPSLSIGEATQMIIDSPDTVADADMVVLWANPLTSAVRPGSEHCIALDGIDPGPFAAADFEPFAADLGAAVDLIWQARDDQPTVIRMMDLYMIDPAVWESLGVADSCRSAWEAQSAAVEQAATEHGATFVSRIDLFNGVDRTQNPAELGYLSSDGFHPSQLGGEAIAEALAATGFEPTSAP